VDGEFLVAARTLALVQFLEVAAENQHLAAHIERFGDIVPAQPERNAVDGSQVGRDVLPGLAVARVAPCTNIPPS